MSRTNARGPIDDVEAFIIAGGKSRRFGGDKLLHPYRGRPLVEHAAGIMLKTFSRVSLVATGGGRFDFLGLPCYPDLVEDVGPLAGVYTALTHSRTDRCFIVGGDMPGLDEGFIRHLADISRDYEVTVPVIYGEYEALHAVYSKSCLIPVRSAIAAGRRRIVSFFPEVKVLEVGEDVISRYARPADMFRNINFRGDIDDAPAR